LSSGVKGFTTIHAGSARQALTRLRFICQLADTASEIPLGALNTLVSEAIDVVVHTDRGPNGPEVMSIIAVEDLAGGTDAVQFTVTELFARARHGEPLRWTGQIPSRLAAGFAKVGSDVGDVLSAHYRPSEVAS